MKDMPKRQKILVGILAVLLVVAAYMQLSGGGSETVSAPSPPPAAVKPSTGTGSGGASGSSGSGSSGIPADPTQEQRPQGMQITQPGNFPGTEPPVIAYNPYIPPDVTTQP